MKKNLLILFVLTSIFGFGQSDCKPYVPNNQGDTWEITSYSPKDKETGKVHYELLSKTETDSVVTFSIKSTSYDDKGENVYENTFDAICEGEVFTFDMEMMINGAQMEAYKEMDVELDATEFQIPPTDTAYTGSLEDGQLNIKVGSNGVSMINMTVHVYDRKMSGVEEVTTTAGTFECVKLEQKVRTKMVVKIEASSTEWYCEGVGMVRSESFNKKGKLTGYSVLTKLGTKTLETEDATE